MDFDLAAMVKRARPTRRRKTVDLRPIQPTATQAADLYASFYAPVIKAWQEASERIEAEYARSLPAGTTRDSVFDIEAVIDRENSVLTRLILTLVPSLRRWALRMEHWQRGKWRGAVLSATGVDLDTLLSAGDVTETVEAFIARNVALVRSVSDEARSRIADITFRSFQEIRPTREVAKEMSAAAGLSRKRARRIAQDQSSKLAAALDQARQEQAGGSKFKWHHSRKLHPRQEHKARDGNIYAWTDPAIVGDKPGMAPYCGCRAGFVLELD